MSSTEQAPEPTMDEILASIRRIIADDEANSGSRPEPSKPAAVPSREPEERRDQPASSNIMDEFTQALRGTGEGKPAAPASSQPEEDILDLDLTNEVVESAKPEPAPFPLATSKPEPRAVAKEEPPMPPRAEPSSERRRLDPPVWDQGPRPAPAEPEAPNREPETRAEPPAAADTRNRNAAVMERITELAAAAARTSGAEAERSFMGYAETKFAAREEVEPEPEAVAKEPAEEKAPPPAFTPKAPAEPKSFAPEAPAEPKKAEVSNGAAKSLEECVREMLRPMIREWLDTNMQRILETAIREELAVQVRDKRQHH